MSRDGLGCLQSAVLVCWSLRIWTSPTLAKTLDLRGATEYFRGCIPPLDPAHVHEHLLQNPMPRHGMTCTNSIAPPAEQGSDAKTVQTHESLDLILLLGKDPINPAASIVRFQTWRHALCSRPVVSDSASWYGCLDQRHAYRHTFDPDARETRQCGRYVYINVIVNVNVNAYVQCNALRCDAIHRIPLPANRRRARTTCRPTTTLYVVRCTYREHKRDNDNKWASA